MSRESWAVRALRDVWRRGGTPVALNPFLQFESPGHFYSRIPSDHDVALRLDDQVTAIAGVDLHGDTQLALLTSCVRFIPETAFHDRPGSGLRYGCINDFFSYGYDSA